MKVSALGTVFLIAPVYSLTGSDGGYVVLGYDKREVVSRYATFRKWPEPRFMTLAEAKAERKKRYRHHEKIAKEKEARRRKPKADPPTS